MFNKYFINTLLQIAYEKLNTLNNNKIYEFNKEIIYNYTL